MFDALDMGASGLQAQRVRMDTIAGNILHANTTGEPDTGAMQRVARALRGSATMAMRRQSRAS